MKKTVLIINYGMGNIFSVSRALEHCEATPIISDNPDDILTAERVILPGVGAFADAMQELRKRELIKPIQQFVRSGRPFLGICLGMEMMLDSSEEFGQHEGLGLIPGRVTKISSTNKKGEKHKIPHIGWNELTPSHGEKSWKHTILEEIPVGTSCYFVHSFTAVPRDSINCLADCNYNGIILSAVIRSGNAYGCQFHPEKSGAKGLRMIQNFLMLKHYPVESPSLA